MTFCCPGSEYDFRPGGTEGCESLYHRYQTLIATYTDDVSGQQSLITVDIQQGDQLDAFGITIVSASPAASSTTSSALSTGAAVGIGIGTAIGVIFLFLLGWLLYRRNKRRPDEPMTTRDSVQRTEPLDVTCSAVRQFSAPGAAVPKLGHGTSRDLYRAQAQSREFSSSETHKPLSELAA
ncbi:hypothetical protein NPX13_g6801 [Xylaria arbuscula]|uniref:Mid2 domain-containing protein n=1 Tax=Xylaria arbuscula TaxID=114810 RepID=A0A9W8NBS1_9PEZI|nr:hypothetical protein NPX13_g6801 [Xylaria arbuscula]